MRYTTIIDITEVPAVYRNPSTARLYIHMALKAGYHDDDRDVLDISIRNLAAASGLTLSACRHALRILEKAQLISRQGDVWMVKKWLPASPISARPKKAAPGQDAAREAERKLRERQERKENQERQASAALAEQGKTPFMAYYEGLQAKAAAGDMEAARLVKKHEATYNQHRQKMEEKSK